MTISSPVPLTGASSGAVTTTSPAGSPAGASSAFDSLVAALCAELTSSTGPDCADAVTAGPVSDEVKPSAVAPDDIVAQHPTENETADDEAEGQSAATDAMAAIVGATAQIDVHRVLTRLTGLEVAGLATEQVPPSTAVVAAPAPVETTSPDAAPATPSSHVGDPADGAVANVGSPEPASDAAETNPGLTDGGVLGVPTVTSAPSPMSTPQTAAGTPTADGLTPGVPTRDGMSSDGRVAGLASSDVAEPGDAAPASTAHQRANGPVAPAQVTLTPADGAGVTAGAASLERDQTAVAMAPAGAAVPTTPDTPPSSPAAATPAMSATPATAAVASPVDGSMSSGSSATVPDGSAAESARTPGRAETASDQTVAATSGAAAATAPVDATGAVLASSTDGPRFQPAAQVANRVAAHLQSAALTTAVDPTNTQTAQRLSLRLDPPNLGTVELVVTMRGGDLHVSVGAAAHARAALENGTGDLQRLLGQLNSGSTEVSWHDPGSGAHHQSAGQSHSGQREAGEGRWSAPVAVGLPLTEASVSPVRVATSPLTGSIHSIDLDL